MGCELFLGREAFIIPSSQVVSNLGGCHAAASLGEDTSGTFLLWQLISLKPKENFQSSALLLHLAEFGQRLQLGRG